MGFPTGPAILSDISPYASYTTVPSGYMVGQFIMGSNGKGYRLSLMGELAVVGNIYQGPVIDTQFNELTAIASAISTSGVQTVQVTNGTTTITANQFDGGTAVVAVTPDIGSEYTIIGHTTGASGATITLTLDRPLGTAWTTATRVTLRRSPWSGVVKAATTLTASVAGVAVYPIPSGSYGLLQTKGVTAVYSDSSTFAAGSDVGVPGATAGYIGVNVAGTGKCNTVGRAMQANSSGKPVPIELCID